ncbi:hypothetical protein [Clavibacter michiganensis]|uniref:hypothetical protein n=1 Tax=Clavibacter michiganensis TaxID=28447 RepID=UPI0026DCBF6B|nr:hypothetical protein [Clavibacter michiganensis]MDO4039326.1 hypothetical protein [Clavibacter michiganensis]MDO4063963.1 hypothetical protein [Clavibacter michiganensis]MDO4110178.1 hypothetical protein [Clavibacter michiganensis]MDO4113356.1 hypothetical protein [Clavibacter michiganensis]MDO4116692.1 hypothetical protein [Clavibacter michiganensis]
MSSNLRAVVNYVDVVRRETTGFTLLGNLRGMNKFDLFKGMAIGVMLIAMGFGFNAAQGSDPTLLLVVGSILLFGSLLILIFLPPKKPD